MKQTKYLYMTLCTLFLLAMVFFIHQPETATAASKAETSVKNAEKAAAVLYNLSYLPGKATGKNIPEKEYKTSADKYQSAKTVVNKLSAGKTKTNYLNRLKTAKTKIDRGKLYIDGVKSGKKIETKRVALEKILKSGSYNQTTHNAFLSLTSTLKAESPKVTKVYGSKTRDMMKKIYITPAEKQKNSLQIASTVKQAINDTQKVIKSSNAKIAVPYKRLILNIDLIPQKQYREQLKKEFSPVHTALTKKATNAKDPLGKIVLLESEFQKLDKLVSPGKSAAEVPLINQSIKRDISNYPSSEKSLLEKKLNTIMSQLALSTKDIKTLISKKAVAKSVPPEIVKAIATTENGQLKQFTSEGEVFKSMDNGYGIMQITPQSKEDTKEDKSYWDKVKYDTEYNIDAGVENLLKKWHYAKAKTPILPKINTYEPNILENWYFAIMAYNGLSKRNHPAEKDPYQVKVYDLIKENAYVKPYVLKKDDVSIIIQPNNLLSFKEKMQYWTPTSTKSTQLYPKGTKLTLIKDTTFRNMPTTSSTKKQIFKKGQTYTIFENSIEDNNPANLSNWYKVQVSGSKTTWYLSSQNVQ
ncbi:transglycosylase SLT domain-containing protein [Peribacillus butanolivorans]|uniref:transglycosylase SLT domain-containing protein n=1 Tax=Peribacillus butanolivorans TaxID=421767 RepID=UPI0037F1457E